MLAQPDTKVASQNRMIDIGKNTSFLLFAIYKPYRRFSMFLD